ncbi:MAG TPA: hypothetical protein VJ453_13450 [Terriglobales bacterium]|jgi:hypothetical protein|nr:hypothetical protein [Terriglobales bacterium]
MLCKDLKDEIFEAALSGAAPGESVKAHMSACVACEHEFQSLRSTLNVLDTWTAPEPSPYFDVRLQARLRDVKQQPEGLLARWLEKTGIRHLSWKPAAAAAFALVMAVGVYVELPGMGGRKQPLVQAACPVVDLQALDKNQQVLSELQDLDDDTSNDTQTPLNN